MKKRTNVVVDGELLERARRATGEKTYSGAITKALEKVVRQAQFWETAAKWEKLAHSAEGVFTPEYIVEKSAKSLSRRPVKQRLSAHEARVPQRSGKRRGSR